jgi:hypothetical protein
MRLLIIKPKTTTTMTDKVLEGEPDRRQQPRNWSRSAGNDCFNYQFPDFGL